MWNKAVQQAGRSALLQQGVPHYKPPSSRREFLLRGGAGFGAVALGWLLASERARASMSERSENLSPLGAKGGHFPATARNVIFLFMEGGPSHIDLFDPKPTLNKLAGKPLPESFGTVITAMGEAGAPLLASPRKWRQHGEGGVWISDWLPHTAECADELAVIRSCWGDGINHAGGVCQMNTGSTMGGRPSLGSWVTYGLGTENEDLPAFVVLQDNNGPVVNGPRNWGAGFMPAVYQGTRLKGSGPPIQNLAPPEGTSSEQQRGVLEYLLHVNRRHAAARPPHSELEARISSYELAYRMQASAPQVVDLASETAETEKLWHGRQSHGTFGRNCLLAAIGRAWVSSAALPRGRKQVGCTFEYREKPHRTLPGNGSAGGGIAEGFETTGVAGSHAGGVGW